MFSLLCLAIFSVISSAVGDGCPYEVCLCHEKTINCADLNLVTMPVPTPGNSSYDMFLSLSYNRISTIPAGSFPPGINGIDFQLNQITSIDPDAFTPIADTLKELLFAQSLFTELPKAMLKLNNLQKLTIFDMKITFSEDVMIHIGPTLQYLSLSNVGLTMLPAWIHNLTSLNSLLLTNMPMVFPDNIFDYNRNTLSTLNFVNCSLVTIPKALSSLTNLQSLTLDNNQIANISALPNWTNITTLSLDNNFISDAVQLGAVLRSIGGSLQLLQIRENKLIAVPDLSEMVALQSAFLTQNTITNVGAGRMPPSLTALMMEYNHLRSLTSFMRTGISLSLLRFHSNLVTELVGVDIPASVTDIDVAFNLITKITDKSFSPNSSMDSLTLDYNPITEISMHAFDNIQMLAFLSMVGTRITRLPLAMTALTNLQSAYLDRNVQLVCTCAEMDLRIYLQNRSIEIIGDCGLTSITYFLNVLSPDCPT